MKRIILILSSTVILFSSKILAQQHGQYSQYMLNYYLINPASGGTNDYADIRSAYRQQWTGMSGAPQNFYLTGHAPLNKIHGGHDKKFRNKKDKPHHFIGGMVTGQRLGAFSIYSVYGSYGYYLPLTKQWNLSMAASAGLIQYHLDHDKLNFGDNVADPVVSYINGVKPDLSLGIWLSSKSFFGGISTMQLFENRLGSKGSLSHHFYLTGGYSIPLNRNWNIIPSVMMKTVPFTAYQIDMNVKLKFQKLLWAGISYRRSDAIVYLIGVNIKNTMELGYSYDMTTSRLRNYSKGSHEIMLSLKLANKGRMISPSDFW